MVNSSNPSPGKFKAPRLLILGCGNIGMRLLPLVRDRFRVFAVTSDVSRHNELRAAGAIPIAANLDDRFSLARVGKLAPYIVHMVPPQAEGMKDKRTRNLIGFLPENATLIYISTTGVYGDCSGAQFDETRPVNPQSDRAKRRVDAEQVLRAWGRRNNRRLAILRVPGIYAADRLPIERLQKNLPALLPEEDVYTNHIHADDLAQIIALALFRTLPGRIYHAVDDSDLKMGEYFDIVANTLHLPRPPRLPRSELPSKLSPMAISFMSESRRLLNKRLKTELGIHLRYPLVQEGGLMLFS
jgi:nucleoside-diphosphate-sugar epimerase